MAGMFLCFVVPGILAGLLLGEGARHKEKKNSRVKPSSQRKPQYHAVASRKSLYVSDLRSEWKPKHTQMEENTAA